MTSYTSLLARPKDEPARGRLREARAGDLLAARLGLSEQHVLLAEDSSTSFEHLRDHRHAGVPRPTSALVNYPRGRMMSAVGLKDGQTDSYYRSTSTFANLARYHEPDRSKPYIVMASAEFYYWGALSIGSFGLMIDCQSWDATATGVGDRSFPIFTYHYNTAGFDRGTFRINRNGGNTNQIPGMGFQSMTGENEYKFNRCYMALAFDFHGGPNRDGAYVGLQAGNTVITDQDLLLTLGQRASEPTQAGTAGDTNSFNGGLNFGAFLHAAPFPNNGDAVVVLRNAALTVDTTRRVS